LYIHERNTDCNKKVKATGVFLRGAFRAGFAITASPASWFGRRINNGLTKLRQIELFAFQVRFQLSQRGTHQN